MRQIPKTRGISPVNLNPMSATRAKTLLRLNASPYQRNEFFQKEKQLAESWGLNYLYFDSQSQNLPQEFPLPYEAPYIIISNTHTEPENIPKEILQKTHLWIHSNSGYDNFPVDWVQAQTFPILTGNPIRKEAVVEYTLGHLFSHFGSHPHQSDWNKQRIWDRELLSDQNVLIIGKGLIGRSLGDCLSPLVNRLTYWDPHKDEGQSPLKSHIKANRVFILAASLNPTSHQLINKEILGEMPSNFLLLNPARGPLIDQSELIKKLKECPKAFAYLDVFESEPYGDEFKGLTNIHQTSHIAGVFKGLQDKILKYEGEILKSYAQKEFQDLLAEYEHLDLKNRIQKDYLL